MSDKWAFELNVEGFQLPAPCWKTSEMQMHLHIYLKSVKPDDHAASQYKDTVLPCNMIPIIKI